MAESNSDTKTQSEQSRLLVASALEEFNRYIYNSVFLTSQWPNVLIFFI
jgi:hypothetical protein